MKQKLHTSYSLTKAWTIVALLLMFLSVSILNQTPFIKDLTNHPSAESILEANALTLIKKTYKVPAPEQLHFMLASVSCGQEKTDFKEVERSTITHLFSIDRLNSKYSNIPPPSLS